MEMSLNERIARANNGWVDKDFLLDLVNRLARRLDMMAPVADHGWVGPAHVMETNGKIVVSMTFHAQEMVPTSGTLFFRPKDHKPKELADDRCTPLHLQEEAENDPEGQAGGDLRLPFLRW